MQLTIIHPAIGHRQGENYIRTWQMEPLPAATIAGLTPTDVDLSFYDDRMEEILFDEPTDAAVLSVETYTAKRAYQIASEYRKRRVPVIVGGFHATLLPEEAERFAESVVTGEAENIWPTVVDDLRHGALKKRYDGGGRPSLDRVRVDRSIFRGKHYLPIGLIEAGRGCRFPCEFCAIQTFFQRTRRLRPIDRIIEELRSFKDHAKLFFFVDDNFAGDIRAAKELLVELACVKVRWVTQMSIDAAYDEEFLELLSRSGCKGVLIGFESLDRETLRSMNKGFNTMKGGYEQALGNLRRYNIRVYATFIFGYENDTEDSFKRAVEFAIDQRFYIAAFNHLTPFPGTPLYSRLKSEKRMRFDAWWLDERYRYNDVPFVPKRLAPEQVTRLCVESRRQFYSWPSIAKRGFNRANRKDLFMLRNFLPINAMHRADVSNRNSYPLGDENWRGMLLEASR